MDKREISISNSTLIKITLVFLVLVFAFLVRDILVMFLAALILAIAFDRPIDKLQNKGLPRAVAAIFVYAVILIVFVGILYFILPSLAVELRNIAVDYAGYFEQVFYPAEVLNFQTVEESLNLRESLEKLTEFVTESAQTILGAIFAIFGGVLSFLIIIFIALFLNIQEKGVKKFLFYLAPEKHQDYVLSVFDKIQRQVSNWLWGRAGSSVLVGLSTFIGLQILGIPFSLTLATIAFLFNFIPFIGPAIAAVPAVLIALSESFLLAVGVIILYVFINNILEGFVFVPLLMKKAVNLNPAILIVLIMIGARLAGILGVIIAIPFAAIVSVVIEEYLTKKKLQAERHPNLV